MCSVREVVQHGVIRNLLLVCVIEFGCSKRVFEPGSYSVPFCLRTEMKIVDKRRSSSLAGMFSIPLDSFSDSQNFFYAFKSLLVLVFDFIFARSFLRTQICQRLLVSFTCFLVKIRWSFHLVLLTPIFWYSFFVTFWGQLLQDRSRCRSRWEKRAIEKDRNRFANKKSRFWLVSMRENPKKSCLITRLVGKLCLCLMQNSFLAILLAMLFSRKPVQRRGIGEKCGFFRYFFRRPKG